MSGMDVKEIYEYLCYNDKRNPFLLDEDKLEPRANCYCDNCFYGRDRLALELLDAKMTIDSLQKTIVEWKKCFEAYRPESYRPTEHS